MNNNQSEIEASEWLARLDRDEPSASDLAAFGQWKSADSRNAAAYARLAATWQALDRIRAIRPTGNMPIDNDYFRVVSQQLDAEASHSWLADALLDSEAESKESRAEPSSESSTHWLRRSTPQHRPWVPLAFAASVFVAGAVILIFRSTGSSTYSTGIGGFQRIILADQSAVELNTDSEVRVELSPNLRRIELIRGEAIFEVAHDASRPFIVSAGGTAVRAVGTKFDVRRLDTSVEVSVTEGKVAVGEPSLLVNERSVVTTAFSQIHAGQAALASGRAVKVTEVPRAEMTRKLAWQNQMLVFDGDSLPDIVAQFNRYNERQMVIADKRLASRRIGGYFRPTNLDAFISVLQSDFNIDVSTNGNRIELTDPAVR
jgi:transmembrane sensor